MAKKIVKSDPGKVEELDFNNVKKLLKDTAKKIKEEQIKLTKEIPQEVDTDKIVSQETLLREEKQLKSLEKQYSIILSSIFRLINPVLKNWRIDVLSTEEINTLSKAVLDVSEKGIKKTVHKIEKRIESLGIATRFFELFAVLWEILVPRYSQLKTSVELIKQSREEKARYKKPKKSTVPT